MTACEEQSAMRIEDVYTSIKIGMDRADVERFLMENGFEVGAIEGQRLRFESDVADGARTRLAGLLRNTGWRPLLSREAILVRVDLDADDRVINVFAFKESSSF